MLRIHISAISDKGVQRDGNEDMLSLSGDLIRDAEARKVLPLDPSSVTYALVADGMGGHEKGEYASEFALTQIKYHISNIFVFENDFPVLVKSIGDDLNLKAQEQGQVRPMGCTLTGVVWFRGKTWIVNAGDSRTYRLRNGLLKQLTEDEDLNHKYGEDLGPSGLALYNCIGGGCDSTIRLDDYTDKLMSGDTILVCSDGLTDMVPDDFLERFLSDSSHPAKELVELANQNGGADNISVVVIRLEECPDAPLLHTSEHKKQSSSLAFLKKIWTSKRWALVLVTLLLLVILIPMISRKSRSDGGFSTQQDITGTYYWSAYNVPVSHTIVIQGDRWTSTNIMYDKVTHEFGFVKGMSLYDATGHFELARISGRSIQYGGHTLRKD